MINTEKFVSLLKKKKIDFISGVPDSCLNNFVNSIRNHQIKHIVAPNEGSAVALGLGNYLKTKKIPLIYMQNSGIGNAADPITNLCHSKIYSIPMILLVGWRGSPNIKDEPQHYLTGKIIKEILRLFNVKTCIIKNNNDIKKVSKIIDFSKKHKKIVACLVEPKIFSEIKLKKDKKNLNSQLIFRPDVVRSILSLVKKNTKIISTVGYVSRELYQIRKLYGYNKGKDFLMVGGMGHAAMTSLGVSISDKNDIICLDGDGAFLMHMGGIATSGILGGKNFKYILLDNGSHESVGKQPTISKKLDYKKLALGFGFKKYYYIKNRKNLKNTLKKYLKNNGPIFIYIKIRIGTLNQLERPKNFKLIKKNFMK